MKDILATEPTLAAALRESTARPLLAPLISPPLTPWQAIGLDLILEGFLLHHGRARHLDLPDHGRSVLAGDYCYAHGLVRIADADDLFLIQALADLIALGAGLVTTGERAALVPLWRGTAAAIAARGRPGEDQAQELYAEARTSMRTGALAPALSALDALTRNLPETPELSEAFA